MPVMTQYVWIFSLASLVFVCIGWRVVYWNARKIATRAESKAAADHLIKILNEISDTSVAFWLSGGSSMKSSNQYSLTILGKVTQAYEFVNILQRREVKVDDDFLSNISMKATLNCEVAHIFKPTLQAEHAQEVMECCMNMISHIFTQFELCYPPAKEFNIDTWADSLGPNRA
ncbi:TPA: hypothetical protein R4368_003610 [Yersinia enterocolitica]|nr:hypothetical protein [Yersinia aldovae]EKN4883215.1 hypothetical protein [Yersinia enterocolitica]EKN6093436.1 hypothetical protein [Yersinia enterocolitica]EKN6127608.1 hypothetical protein [Yersinia enterocolitica]CQH63964.1 Uncharacterised protein [Yersinia enterocolitica]HDL6601751.1 hypothetical protein [Yersinia enterocolitica]